VRELSDADAYREAGQLADYVAKPGSRGAMFWLDTKGFSPEDRRVITLALADIEDGAA
jgi:hypothetical protein